MVNWAFPPKNVQHTIQASRSFEIQQNFKIPSELIVSNLHTRKYSDFQYVLNKISDKSRFSLTIASDFRKFETSCQLPSTKYKAALQANNYIQFFICISEIVETYHSENLIVKYVSDLFD